jgi:hypothetical protein
VTERPERDESVERDRYGIALLLLIASTLVFAVVDQSAAGRILLLTTQAVTVLVIFHASRLPVRLQRVAAALLAVAVVAASATAITGGEGGLWAPAVTAALMVLVSPVAIVRRVRHRPRIDFTTVLAALSLYVLAGLFFAYLFLFLGDLRGHDFFVQIPHARTVDYVYFSYVTLATLGYGDLTPATDVGRMLAVTETVLGQLYLVGAVAAIVSNLGRVRA